MEFLGHKISDKDLDAKMENLKALLKVEAPRGLSELRRFLGLVTYYSKFLPDASTVLAPLYELLRAKAECGHAQKQTFQEVETLLKEAV